MRMLMRVHETIRRRRQSKYQKCSPHLFRYITTTTTGGGGSSPFYISLLARIVENVHHTHVCMTYETFTMCNINHSQCCITLYSLRIKFPLEFTHGACVKITNKKVSSPSYARFMKSARDLLRFDGLQVLFLRPHLFTLRYSVDSQ